MGHDNFCKLDILYFCQAKKIAQLLCVWNWYMSNVQRSTFNASFPKQISLCLFFASHFSSLSFGGKVNLVLLKPDSLSLRNFSLFLCVFMKTNILFVGRRAWDAPGNLLWFQNLNNNSCKKQHFNRKPRKTSVPWIFFYWKTVTHASSRNKISHICSLVCCYRMRYFWDNWKT